VTGGTYNRTYTNTGSGPTVESDPATVGDFRLDKYEVTVGRFRQFVAAWNNGAGWTPPAASGKHTHLNGGSGLAATGGGYEPGWAVSDNANVSPTDVNLACDVKNQTWTPFAVGNEKRPANCASWYEAAAFCIWDGGFLPSEAEWEYAAAGGSQERQYPWASTAPGTSNQYAIYGCFYPSSSGTCTGVASIAPVGTPTAGAAKWGQLDLAGNEWEWNLDWYAPYGACTNCTNATVPPAPSNRVVRGGDFTSGASFLLPPGRGKNTPVSRSAYYGFRCARTP
jgi:formylglycine-generating enzyme required for sulfatase activity